MSATTLPASSDMMRAAVRINGRNEFIIQKVPIPVPGPKQVLLKVAAAGVCHSDTFILSDFIPDPRKYITGHENVGRAVKIGQDVVGIEIDKLYAVYAVVPHAMHLLPNFPPFLDSIGIGENGGYAEYLVVDASQLIPVPSGLQPQIAALAADSLITVYNAVHNVAGLRPGTKKRVLIYGVGGLGHQAVQLVKHYGATVFACDYKPSARDLAVSLGAEQAFHPAELETLFATTEVGSPDRFGVDVVIDLVSTAQSFSLSMEAVKGDGNSLDGPHGLIVVVGVSGETFTFNPATLLIFRTHVLTSLYGSKEDLKASLDLLKHRVVVPIVSVEALENTDRVIDDLRASRVTGRKVIVPSL